MSKPTEFSCRVLDYVQPNGEPIVQTTKKFDHEKGHLVDGTTALDMGERSLYTDPETGAQKQMSDARFDLIPPDALTILSRVYGMGAQKYADHNWLKGYPYSLSIAALSRHVQRFVAGEDLDDESGLPHLAHAAWHCFTLLTFANRGLGADDRYVVVRKESA